MIMIMFLTTITPQKAPTFANVFGLEVGSSDYRSMFHLFGSNGNIMPGGTHSSSMRQFGGAPSPKGWLLIDATDVNKHGSWIIDTIDISSWKGVLGNCWGHQHRHFSCVDKLSYGMSISEVKAIMKGVDLTSSGPDKGNKPSITYKGDITLVGESVATIKKTGKSEKIDYLINLIVSEKKGLYRVIINSSVE